MTRELLLLRHGKSDWDKDCDDFDRPLNARGQRDAARIGCWMQAHHLLPDGIFSSPARRAAQTAQAICTNAGTAPDRVLWIGRLYLASLETLLEFIGSISTNRRRVMLIGHNPGLEDLLEYLSLAAGRYRQQGKLLTTATLACLSLDGDWSHLDRGSCELERFIRPRGLPQA